jgi:hypothetical protein
MATVAPGAAVWAVRTRLSLLDANGYVDAGANTFTTDQLVKATATPVYESGDAIAVKTAAGELGVYAKHGDILKWGTLSLELALPDPQLEQILAGGVVFSSSAAALGAPTGLTATPQTTLGTLAAAAYSYQVTQYNSWGETVPSTNANATTTGTTGTVVLTGMSLAVGGLGWRFYGRIGGTPLLMGTLVGIGTQATSSASGTGSPTTLSVTNLTAAIPIGYTFQIAGDSNTVKIVFTTTQAAGIGANILNVTVSQSITTTIAAGNLVPCFVDNGATIAAGAVSPPGTDLSAGPGTGAGYQMPAPGSTAAPNGVSIEIWQKRIINGFPDGTYPYWRTVYPRAANLHIMPRDHTNANLQTVIEGDLFRNPNWGSGPFGDWPLDSSQMAQRKMEGAATLPTAGYAAVPATQTT